MDAPVPAAVLERLGPEATAWVLQNQKAAGQELKADIMEAATQRFERRLAEEMAKLRVEMAAMEARLTGRIGDVVKWCFLFWVGQVVTMTAIMSFLLRAR